MQWLKVGHPDQFYGFSTSYQILLFSVMDRRNLHTACYCTWVGGKEEGINWHPDKKNTL